MNYISLGYFCSVAMELEEYGLRNFSSPFDWCKCDFEGTIKAIANNFKDFLTLDNLSQNAESPQYYRSDIYNIRFFHDFNKYDPLEKQLPQVQKKYNRRIARFYNQITEPTLFFRYISDEEKTGNKSSELIWIEENYAGILQLLKSFNKENDIIFIANKGVTSNIIKIYNVDPDNNDIVARKPTSKNPELKSLFENLENENKQENIARYQRKQALKKVKSFRKSLVSHTKDLFIQPYKHYKLY